MRTILLIFLLGVCTIGKTQQKIEVYPGDKCVEQVSYGAFLPANINSDQDKQTQKNLEQYQLEFTVDKEKYHANETVQVVLSNKGEKNVELAVQSVQKESGKSECKSKNQDYVVWIGEQGEISLIHINFLGENKTIGPGQSIEFRIHPHQAGKYKFGLLIGNEAFGDAGLIVTPAFEIAN